MDQAIGLRRMAEDARAEIQTTLRRQQTARGVRVLAVTSGKGGVGKTHFAVNLSLALAALGQKVFLLDADLGLANADLVLGVEPRYHLGHVLEGTCRLEEAICEGPRGIRLLPGGTALNTLADLAPSRIADFLSQLGQVAGRGEVLVVDTGAGISGQVRAFLAAAGEVMLVTTPEPTALTDAYATIKVLTRDNPAARIYLVVNQAESPAEAREAVGTLTRVCKRYLSLDIVALDAIPKDPRVPRAVRERQPFILTAPQAPASRAVDRVARHLLSMPVGYAGWGGFWSRILQGLGGGRS